MIAVEEFPVKAKIAQRQRQFLTHSFLYYVLNENVISDSKYDEICTDMTRLMRAYPVEAIESPYYDLCLPCGNAGSGFYIDKYPPQIITTALRLLYHDKKPNEDFGQFIGRWGYHIIQK